MAVLDKFLRLTAESAADQHKDEKGRFASDTAGGEHGTGVTKHSVAIPLHGDDALAYDDPNFKPPMEHFTVSNPKFSAEQSSKFYSASTGKYINPTDPTKSEYGEKGQIGHVMDIKGGDGSNVRDLRYITGYAAPGHTVAAETSFKYGSPLGSKHEWQSENSGRMVSHGATVVGIHIHDTGEKVGLVPDRNMPHYVQK